MKRAILIGFGLGICVCGAFRTAYELSGHRYLFGYETLLLWPSSILLGYTDGREESPIGLVWLVISVLLNGALYAVLATIVHAVLRRAGPGRREP